MRLSIKVQSSASVPPAPAWIERNASFGSTSPESRFKILSFSNSAFVCAYMSRTSASSSAPPLSSASSSIASKSSCFFNKARHGSTLFFKRLISFMTLPAFSLSSQNPGAAVSASFSAIFLSTLAASKTPPNVHDIFAKRGNGHFYIFYHTDTPKLIIGILNR